MKRKALVLAIAAAAVGMGLGQTQAAGVESLFFMGNQNQLSDNSGESQHTDTNGNSKLDVGDSLRGIAGWSTVEDQTGAGGVRAFGTSGANANSEFTSVFQAKVYGSSPSTPAVLPGNTPILYDFGPDPAFATEWEVKLGLPAGTLAGAMVVFFEDTALKDYDRTNAAGGTIALSEATATNGTGVWAWGMGIDAGSANLGLDGILSADDPGAVGDELWRGIGPYDPSIGASVPAGTSVGFFNFSLSVVYNGFSSSTFFEDVLAGSATGLGDGKINVNAAGGVLGTLGANTPYDIWDDVNAVFRPNAVPEPTSLALLGLGLAGLGAVRRRRSA